MKEVTSVFALEPWMQKGNCYNNDEVKRYQAKGEDVFYDQGLMGIGIRICKYCPVSLECLAYANRTNQSGIWGGLTDSQRRRSQKKNQKAIEAFLERTKERQPDGEGPNVNEDRVPA